MKKGLLITIVLISALMLSACTVIPASTLEAMFRTDSDPVITSGETSVNDKDTVTISREEYEKYKQFSEMFSIYDAANEFFYQDVDQQKMIEYATRGLMTGLDDPYSYYYNPKEYAEMWEDDEGNYVGIGVLIQSNMETQVTAIQLLSKSFMTRTLLIFEN